MMYCTYCGSENLEPFRDVYKCLECGRIVRKPIIIDPNAQKITEETE